MKISIVYFLGLVFVLASCIYQLDRADLISGDSYLVVEAEFSDLSVQQSVRLSYSATNKGNTQYIKHIEKAIVYITDSQGNIINFLGGSISGQYVSNISGVVGETYTLHIETPDGKKYRSKPETMQNCPKIEKIYPEFEENSQFSINDSRRYGWNLFVDFTDSPEKDAFYQWSWIHYERIMFCAVCSGGRYNATSKNCEVLENQQGSTNLYRCNTDCWDIERNETQNLLRDDLFNGQKVERVFVCRVPHNSPPLKYYLQVQQRRISKEVYLYFKSLQAQSQSNGTLFDIPAQTQFSLNIFSEADPTEKILGVFNVFSAKTQLVYVNRRTTNGISPAPNFMEGKEVLIPPTNTPFLVPCFNSFVRTNLQPTGWED
jgi:hypothetical protein